MPIGIARDTEDDAIMAICARRCASIDEIAAKFRYLAGLGCDREPRQRDAFFWSILREGALRSRRSFELRAASCKPQGSLFSFGTNKTAPVRGCTGGGFRWR